jgi:hypothetical protein
MRKIDSSLIANILFENSKPKTAVNTQQLISQFSDL